MNILNHRAILVISFLLAAVISVFVVLMPVIVSTSRFAITTTILLGICMMAVFIIKPLISRPRTRYVTIIILLLFIAWFAFGGRQVNTEELRNDYINQMRSFTGTPYRWGGETSRGIDCSGLARTCLWQAMLKQGVKHANPKLLGTTLWRFWWRDMSARDMGNEGYGYTRIIGHADKLSGCDTSNLLEGDLAVVTGGHVLIYCGNSRWIEASPEDLEVTENEAKPDSKRVWFDAGPVTFVRWWILAG